MYHLLHFLDNSTVAGLITVWVGIVVGKRIYVEQKEVDRKYKAEETLLDNLLLLEEHCKAINQTIDRLAGTYIRIVAEKDMVAAQKFATESLTPEIEKAVEILMYKLPENLSKIESIVALYFYGEKIVEDKIQEVFTEVKIWHDFVQNYATGKTELKFDLSKRVSEIPMLSLEKLNSKIVALISSLHKNYEKPRGK